MPRRKPKEHRKNRREQGHRYIVTEVFQLIRVILPIILDDILR